MGCGWPEGKEAEFRPQRKDDNEEIDLYGEVSSITHWEGDVLSISVCEVNDVEQDFGPGQL